MLSFFTNIEAGNNGTAYDYEFNAIDGGLIKLDKYEGKVIVVVNVASRCGYTPQYEDLQKLWTSYQNKDLVVIGVPTNKFFVKSLEIIAKSKIFVRQILGLHFQLQKKLT